MQIINEETQVLLRLDKGDDLFGSLMELADIHNWQTAQVTGIGALCSLELGYFEIDKKDYFRKKFSGDYELLSLEGNISRLDNNPFCHLHGVFSGKDFSCIGGHMFSGTVAVTAELVIRPFNSETHRCFNQQMGFKEIQLCGINGKT